MPVEVKPKKAKDTYTNKLWRYPTEYVDLMLWQYGTGMLELANNGIPLQVWTDTMNELAEQRYQFYESQYKVSPSFKIQFVIDGNRFELTKISL